MKPAVLIIGDNMWDETRVCHVKGISPEAPIPKVEVDRVELRPGGMWNTQANLISLGCETIGIGYLDGADGAKPINDPFPMMPVGYVDKMERRIRYVDERTGHQILRVDEHYDKKPWPDSTFHIALGHWIRLNHNRPIHIVISDYAHGVVGIELSKQVKQAFNGWRQPIYVFSDTRQDFTHFWNLALPIFELAAESFWIPNLEEYYRSYECEEMEYVEIIRKESEHGVSWLRLDGTSEYHLPAENSHVVDVTGAGDTFIAAFTACFITCQDIKKSMQFANHAAAITCSKRGVYAVTLEDMRKK